MERKFILNFSILFIGIIFIFRLFYLQVIDSKYKPSPFNNSAIAVKYDYPERGFIYDRNHTLLVANQTSYDIMITPRDVKALDTSEFCKLLKISKKDFIINYKRAKNYSTRIPSVFLTQLSKENYAYLQEKMHKYKGFYIQKRSLRQYPINSAANVVGYIGEVNNELLKKNSYYQLGELIGIQGVEKQYEDYLRGVKGVKFIQRNRFNKEIGPYKGGSYDTLSSIGQDVTITIDSKLQQYGEALMANKRGGIVAIEPSTGEILALVSTPSYDPNLLVGRERSKNFTELFYDSIKKPLFDRSLLAQYPPGSPFKIIDALIGLQEQVITPDTYFYCYHGFKYGRGPNAFMKCHCGIYASPIKLNRGIYRSCNSYFANVYKRIIEKFENPEEGMNVWSDHVKSFGLGNYLNNDLSTGAKGLIPDADFYNRYYPKGSWRASTTISNAIGQGEVLTTPIQLANMTAAVANRGYFYTPHIIKKISDIPISDVNFTEPKKTSIDSTYFKPVIEGMFNVFEKNIGTARSSRVKGIEICGKTGTSENPHGQDHSIFIAFAPKDNPKIAIAIVVENGYWGSRWAGPIATLMIEKYLKGKTIRPWLEKRMLEGSLQDEYERQLIEEKQIAKKEN
jgi:penicillin-binding protein 2